MMADEILSQSYGLIRQMKQWKNKDLEIIPLAGDASMRQYFRVQANDTSYVLMLTEAFKPEENNFLLIRELLEEVAVPAPKLQAVDGALGGILLEDLTDRTMLHELGDTRNSAEELVSLKKSIDLLVSFHKNTNVSKERSAKIPGFSLFFGEEKLMWEVDFTIEHLLKNYLKRSLDEKRMQAMRDAFADICKRLAAEPRVFTHRDYHSRNIMIPSTGIYTSIDFQDARMGLRQYDLASILRDSYYQLSDEQVYAVLDYYIEQVKIREGISLDRKHFIEMFDLMSIQRNFKAIGSFTSFYARRGNLMYLRFVGNTFENVRKNLLKFPEYRDLLSSLYQLYYF